MRHKFVSHNNLPRLIVIYAGWGMDERPFESLRRPGYDILVVWDYRSFDIDWSVAAPYDEICLIAWSMGVYAASMSSHGIENKVTARIAVNGTMTPVDNLRGIPEAIFEGTAASLDERNLVKFYRRMCGDRATTDAFMAVRPQRGAPELVDELRAIWPEPVLGNPKAARWDRAIIGRRDAIFPACNQDRAWAGVPKTFVDAPHYIALQTVIDRFIIDKQLTETRFEAGRETYNSNATVQIAMIDHLRRLLRATGVERKMSADYASVAEIGCGTGLLSGYLSSLTRRGRLSLWDITSTAPDVAAEEFISCDAEIKISRTQSERYDVIATSATVQWFNSPGRFLRECARVLRPGGVVALTTFIKGNMYELAGITGSSLPLLTLDDWLATLPSEFDILACEVHDYNLSFDDPMSVLRHLKFTGVNALSRSASPRPGVSRILSDYPMMLDGRYYLTYKTITMILQLK